MAEKNTNPMGVDLNQDPEDFKKLALGEKEVKPPEPKPEEKPAEEKKPEGSAAGTPPVPKEGAPQDKVDKPTDEPKPAEKETPEPKPSNDAPPPKEEKLTPEEFRAKEAARMIQRQGEERKRAMLAHIEAARANPDHIHTVAKIDKNLANEVIKEVWGYQDYDELIAQSRIAELREKDPEKADLEERLLKVEQDSKKSAADAREQVKKSFFTSKGFTPTEYDPRVVKTLEKLALLNPAFVASDYQGALAEAYRMATGEEVVDPSKEKVQEAVNRAAEPPPSSIKQPHVAPSNYGEAAEGFAGIMGVKLT